MNIRIGTGYDVHAFADNRDLIIGGIVIPHSKGLTGHSDADVLAHAISDALLGALALGNIGDFFPDNDPKYKDADSIELLKEVHQKIIEMGYSIINIDSVIIAQNPKFKPYILAIRTNLASALNCEVECIGVKATTTEWLGFEGREEGIAVQANVLVKKDDI